jgi:alanine racemase
LVTLDVSAVPEAEARPGAMVELMGAHATVDDLARAAGTIPYELLTRLGPRLRRRYLAPAGA